MEDGQTERCRSQRYVERVEETKGGMFELYRTAKSASSVPSVLQKMLRCFVLVSVITPTFAVGFPFNHLFPSWTDYLVLHVSRLMHTRFTLVSLFSALLCILTRCPYSVFLLGVRTRCPHSLFSLGLLTRSRYSVSFLSFHLVAQ